MHVIAALEQRTVVPLLIAFVDLARFFRFSKLLEPPRLADLIDGYYELVDGAVTAHGGRVIKYIGDAALVVFTEERADAAVACLLELKLAADAFLARAGVDSQVFVKVHVGDVVAGLYGGRGNKRFDVLGDAVNIAARLEERPFAITPQVFRKLSPERRARFKKHSGPVCYIRSEDRH